MDKVEVYRQRIQEVIQRHASYKPIFPEIEIYPIFDVAHDHYLLMDSGWHDLNRTYGCVIHMHIKDDKIWIQYDGTEVGTANELVELGVPKEDIVLAFHAPYKRPYTGFGVG
jgi:hypothetical protein